MGIQGSVTIAQFNLPRVIKDSIGMYGKNNNYR